MINLPENNAHHRTVGTYYTKCPKIYAALYYERHPSHRHISEEDHAFEYAANTFLEKIEENSYAGYDLDFEYQPIDKKIKIRFNDEASLISAWNRIYALTDNGNIKVACIAIFSHHSGGNGQSYIGGWRPGETTEDNGDPHDEWNLSGKEIRHLQTLSWIPQKSFIFLANCNGDTGSDNIALSFHKKHSVTVYHSKAYSYFSNSYNKYDKSWRLALGNADKLNIGDLYLLAFARGSHNSNDPDIENYGSGLRVWEGVYK